MNPSLVYSLLSMLPFDAVQYEMPTASSSKQQKPIDSHVTSTELQWKDLVGILGLSVLSDIIKRNLIGGYLHS